VGRAVAPDMPERVWPAFLCRYFDILSSISDIKHMPSISPQAQAAGEERDMLSGISSRKDRASIVPPAKESAVCIIFSDRARKIPRNEPMNGPATAKNKINGIFCSIFAPPLSKIVCGDLKIYQR